MKTARVDWNAEWARAQESGAHVALLYRLRKHSSVDPDAAAYLAMLYREGITLPDGVALRKDVSKSLKYARQAAELGSVWGQREVADHYSSSRNLRLVRRARQIYSRLARRGDVLSMINLGVLEQRHGRFAAAVSWYQKAARRGDVVARIRLAEASLFGAGIKSNPKAALRWLTSTARSSSARLSPFLKQQCAMLLAQAHLWGWHVEKDVQLSIKYLKEASQLGSQAARGLLEDLDA